MAVKLAEINLTNLPTCRAIEAKPRVFRDHRSTNGGIEPKIAVRRVPRVPDTDDALGLVGALWLRLQTNDLTRMSKARWTVLDTDLLLGGHPDSLPVHQNRAVL